MPAKNEFITRRPDSSKHVLRAIDKAIGIGLPSVKLNVVAMRNFNDDELIDFIELTKDKADMIKAEDFDSTEKMLEELTRTFSFATQPIF